MKYEINAELNLQTLAAEARETAEAFIELAENLERIELKYKKPKAGRLMAHKERLDAISESEGGSECN